MTSLATPDIGSPTSGVTNIAVYKFAALRELKSLRDRLLQLSKEFQLKGTILLSPEGINLFVAGKRASIDHLLEVLRSIPGLEDLAPKYSESDHQPFSRMLVRLKKEIIAFGVDGIDPATRTSPKLQARTLKQWLDEGRPITLLDTRNDYEVKLGTFRGAKPIGIDHFRDFPAAVQRLPEDLKEQPIVMFCTGGIRCEKAGPYMEKVGFRNIFQLDGGILKYFEECGGAHYEGECFVFDQRVGVDPTLTETESTQCFHCLTPLSREDQQDSKYQPPHSCPYCFQTAAERMKETLSARHRKLAELIHPLPGSVPYDNYRPVSVPASMEGATVVECLTFILKHTTSQDWEDRCARGLILDENHRPLQASDRVAAGQRLLHLFPATVEPDVSAKVEILHEDEAILVIDKPAPLPMHPSGRFNRNTLQHFIHQLYAPQKPRPAHRLDANTTGLVVFCRTRHYAGRLQPQFAAQQVEKLYLARVKGHPPQDRFQSNATIRPMPGALGTREVGDEDDLPALTEFVVLKRFSDGTALLQAQPKSGRTNQIRVHLWDLGFPICGDPAYLSDGRVGETQTLNLEAPPLCLHSWKLSFGHPLTGNPVAWETAPPRWAKDETS